jgi:Lar family restriction alleviation protein
MDIQLKPCPFCGGKGKFEHIFENPDKCMVGCSRCNGSMDAVFPNEVEAAAAWNRRAEREG